ncbi:MAG TPA: sulfatase-like hydrolase/transferase, partial [Planctomycetota bacterium]|nr:sulfatase-like hydrolase/transferase [Planctomycetota bacterium]
PRETTPEQDAIARYHIAHYYALCTLIDDMVGRIVAALESCGRFDNTLVLYVSDHGEMLWERGRLSKTLFYEPIIRMPLIVVPPKGEKRVKRTDALVETFDVAPTMLDYARAGIPDNMSASTLRPVVEGTGLGKEVALSEYVASNLSFRTICTVTKRSKYVWADGVRPEEFFDLENDPLERTNLINDPAHADEIARHRKLMIDRLSTR